MQRPAWGQLAACTSVQSRREGLAFRSQQKRKEIGEPIGTTDGDTRSECAEGTIHRAPRSPVVQVSDLTPISPLDCMERGLKRPAVSYLYPVSTLKRRRRGVRLGAKNGDLHHWLHGPEEGAERSQIRFEKIVDVLKHEVGFFLEPEAVIGFGETDDHR